MSFCWVSWLPTEREAVGLHRCVAVHHSLRMMKWRRQWTKMEKTKSIHSKSLSLSCTIALFSIERHRRNWKEAETEITLSNLVLLACLFSSFSFLVWLMMSESCENYSLEQHLHHLIIIICAHIFSFRVTQSGPSLFLFSSLSSLLHLIFSNSLPLSFCCIAFSLCVVEWLHLHFRNYLLLLMMMMLFNEETF